MLHFDSDYMEGAHPAILERLAATNFDQTSGYGTDEVCAAARERIREACACPHASVYFLVGGTQANAAAADQILRPWEGIVSATTGHITAHEAGAVEACGRKTLPLPHVDGKLVAADVRALCEAYWGDENREHIVAPGAVYISHPTEYGTVYSLAELEALAQVCRDFDMRLFMDGATAWPPWAPTSRWPTSHACATRSTSAARRWARSAARPWCSRSRGWTTTSSRS